MGVGLVVGMLNSWTNRCSQMRSIVADESALYSAYVDERATVSACVHAKRRVYCRGR